MIPKAKELARLLLARKLPFAAWVECRRLGANEVLVLEVEVELPQRRVHPVQRRETVAVVFDASDEQAPEVLALRADFPLVPHLNVRAQEFPRSLCLYDEPYEVLKLQWAALPFVERIRTWLSRTGKGILHEESQSLEPLLLGYAANLVIPSDLVEAIGDNGAAELQIVLHGSEQQPFLIAKRVAPGTTMTGVRFVASAILANSMQHGVIRRAPGSIADLHEFLKDGGFDLLSVMRSAFKTFHARKEIRNACFLLVLVIPKCRAPGAAPESYDTWAFLTSKSIIEVGQAIGVWQLQDKSVALHLVPDSAKTGSDVALDLLNPVHAMSNDFAARLNGLPAANPARIAAVGLGAIGSQVFSNLFRAGVGQWTLIDDDRLMPHNVARHALYGDAVGFHKAQVLAALADASIDGSPVAAPVEANVLRPGDKADQLANAFAEASVILDMSASVPVARHLVAEVESSAQRVSVFTNPSGKDLVLLAEGVRRKVHLDMLEMQLYRAVATVESLRDHLSGTDGHLRYGRSCRDVSSRLPQDLVALHAAIASRELKAVFERDDPTILIWQASGSPLTVMPVTIEPASVIEVDCGEWRLRTDKHLLGKLWELRRGKLPNETGGVLIGSFDLQRRIAYVVDALPSPPDSEEWPTLYIRGCDGLGKQVEQVKKQTAGMLEYVGEWHSHPNRVGVGASLDDIKVFAWLTELMDADGLPALMMIPGSRDQCGMYVGEIKSGSSKRRRPPKSDG